MSADDAATSWRDLTDQLTREQIAKLEEHERSEDYMADLLEVAREFASRNMIERIYSPDPLPPDSAGSFGWRPADDGDGWVRAFEGTRRKVENAATPAVEILDRDANATRTADVSFYISVEIDGEQHTDGTVERTISLNHGPDDQSIEVTDKAWDLLELEMHPDAARRVAAALAEAADEIEKLGQPVND